MVSGADRLLKDYVNPPAFTNANVKHPEKPGSNLEFLGPSGLFASSHHQICLHQTMTYAHRDKHLNPHSQDLSTFPLICKQLPQGNWTQERGLNIFSNELGSIWSGTWEHGWRRGHMDSCQAFALKECTFLFLTYFCKYLCVFFLLFLMISSQT